jgi:DNA-binding MarR family transcriptional regulator
MKTHPVLKTIKARPGIRTKELAKKHRLSLPKITAVLFDLVAAGKLTYERGWSTLESGDGNHWFVKREARK